MFKVNLIFNVQSKPQVITLKFKDQVLFILNNTDDFFFLYGTY